MIYKLVSCLSIISLSAYGNEVKEKFAISTQSLNRPDIPISFKLTTVHNYKRQIKPEREHNSRRQQESGLKRYPVIQYAPLIHATKREEHQNKINSQETKSEPGSVNTGRHVYTGREKPKFTHLEPKTLESDDNAIQQSYRSFISGHNVEAYLETTGHYLEQGVDPFITEREYYQSKVKPPKFVYYQKLQKGPETSQRHNLLEAPPVMGDYKFLEFLPSGFKSPATHEHKKSLLYAYSFDNQLPQEKQQPTYAHPRIHLNIARSYNVANQPQEAHLPAVFAPKSQPLTSLLLKSQNTLMLPV